MNIIVVGHRHGQSKSYRVTTTLRFLLLGCLFAVPFAMGVSGFWLSAWLQDEPPVETAATEAWEDELDRQRTELEEVREQANQELQALTIRLAELQSRLMRIDALGERLVQATDIGADEFDFSAQPALGGPSIVQGHYQAPDISDVLDQFAERMESRERQLEAFSDILTNQRFSRDRYLAGRPIQKGWMSSAYGTRVDPFTGKLAWHAGVDFAGKQGSGIIAVAAGVVTWSGDRHGYGKMVEVDHGNGYKTRYAHCFELKASMGDIVKKGQVIALMGSTGRSTGPHVHFEVYKNGRTVDPATYVHRNHR